MSTERATIVHAFSPDWLGRRYGAAVVIGTVNRYYPAPYKIRRWTASGAKRAGDRAIRRIERREAAHRARQGRSARATHSKDLS